MPFRRLASLDRSDSAWILASFTVLLVCVYYGYLGMLEISLRFLLDSETWMVLENDKESCANDDTCLKPGDRVLRMGTLDHETFLANRTISLYRDWEDMPDVAHPVMFVRDGEIQTIYLRYQRTGRWGARKYAIWIIPLTFWISGVIAIIFLRPRDEKWLVLVLLCFDTTLWGASGFLSGSRIGYSLIVFRFFVWFFLPLALHLHLVLPSRRFGAARKILLIPSYLLAFGLVFYDLIWEVDRRFLMLYMLVAIAISIGFLFGRLWMRDTVANRIVNRVLAFGVGLGLLPVVTLSLVVTYGSHGEFYAVYFRLVGFLFIVILPIWPLSYLYALYKHGEGKSEFRANRLLSTYGFFSLYVSVFVTIYLLLGPAFEDRRDQLNFNLILSCCFVAAAPVMRRSFELAVDKVIYGIRYRPEEVISLFAARIPAAFNRVILVRVILDEILPTLMVRQSALYLEDEDSGCEVVYEQEVTDGSPSRRELEGLRVRAEPFINLNLTGDARFSWIRLMIPLATQDRVIGYWFFGRRDPDDYYPSSDIELLANLGNQVAPVLENVRLVELARQEVAENRRLQEQLVQSQKMEAIGRLSAGVAHDFNNLLSVILGYSSLLLAKYRDDEALAKYLGDIKDAGNRAASLTKQLLAFSRQQVMEAKVVDLNQVIDEVEKMLRRLTGEDVVLLTDLDPALPSVKVDPAQMGQVIMNLAVNARDAMPDGGELRIETRAISLRYPQEHRQQGTLPAGAYVLMRVTDSGTGMESGLISRIFEPYFTTKEMGKGTGLGLSMVYGIINQSKGFIRVESRPGEGTSFLIYLPVSSEIQGGERDEGSHRVPASGRGSETILVVEDEESVRTVACEILESNGYRVLQAANGIEALEGFGGLETSVDLLLTDVIMPQMKGPELARQMTTLRPEMKVVYMSGYNEESMLGKRLGEDGTALIQKPFSPQGLARRVREVLDA